jgi:hypothetical protein
MTKREALMGGPGLSGYAFNSDTWCVRCGQDIIRGLDLEKIPTHLHGDTDHVPQPIFFGDTDREVHCACCGEYMYGTRKDGDE